MTADEYRRSTGHKPPRVLLVEDNPAHAELIMRCLLDHEVANDVVHVGDGQKALDYLLRQGDYAASGTASRPEVLLLDLRLPKVDGLQVLEEVRRHETFDDMPVVVLTTSSARRDVSQAYAKRANSYLVKPSEYDGLVQMIEDFGSYWLHWNRGAG